MVLLPPPPPSAPQMVGPRATAYIAVELHRSQLYVIFQSSL